MTESVIAIMHGLEIYAHWQYPTLQMYFAGETSLKAYTTQAAAFVCHVLPNNSWNQVSYTPGMNAYPLFFAGLSTLGCDDNNITRQASSNWLGLEYEAKFRMAIRMLPFFTQPKKDDPPYFDHV